MSPETHAALTVLAPLLGALVVIERERHGVDCRDLRAAYLALIERPSSETAYAAQRALSTRYLPCAREWRAIEALTLAGSAAAQETTRPRAALACLVECARMVDAEMNEAPPTEADGARG